MERINGTRAAKAISYIVAAIIILLPFHAFLTVWAASVFGNYTVFRLWKEFVIALVAVPAWWMLWHDKPLRARFFNHRLVWLIGGYVALQALVGVFAFLVHSVTAKALAFAWLVDTRYLLFFLICMIIAREHTWLNWHWRRLIIPSAFIVVLIGLLQFFVLPHDFMSHFGYGPNTIAPTETIDHKAAYERVQSTLRGANPLGAYLVVVVAALAALMLRHNLRRLWRAVGLVATMIVLFASGSRSAWIGAAVVFVVIGIVWLLQAGKSVRLLGIILLALVGFSVAAMITFRNNDRFQNIVFHTDEHSRSSISSNTAHMNATTNGLKDAALHPLGQGPGTAGPASVYNDHKIKYAENYFVQILQEVGWLGLALLLAIFGYVVRLLWAMREHSLAVMLLASFIGISFVCFFSHTWTDDTLAYLWWGLAGIVVAPQVLGGRKLDQDA